MTHSRACRLFTGQAINAPCTASWTGKRRQPVRLSNFDIADSMSILPLDRQLQCQRHSSVNLTELFLWLYVRSFGCGHRGRSNIRRTDGDGRRLGLDHSSLGHQLLGRETLDLLGAVIRGDDMGSSQQRLKPANLLLIFNQHRLALGLRLFQPLVVQNRLEMLGHLLAVFHIRRLETENA